MCLGTVEIRVPDTQETSNDWDVLLQRSLPEMLIHSISARQELMEVLESNVDSHAETNSRPNTVSATNPAFEAKHVLGVDTELSDFRLVGGKSNEVFGDISLSTSLPQEPFLGGVGVCGCFGCGEGLGSDEEEGGLWVGVAESLGHVCAIDVRNEVESLLAVAVVLESFCDHDWATANR